MVVQRGPPTENSQKQEQGPPFTLTDQDNHNWKMRQRQGRVPQPTRPTTNTKAMKTHTSAKDNAMKAKVNIHSHNGKSQQGRMRASLYKQTDRC